MEENKIVMYQTEDGQTQIDVRLENDTVWLTQAQMAELFQKDRTVITRHINNVFNEGELERKEVCAKFAHTTRHGAIEGKQQTQETVAFVVALPVFFMALQEQERQRPCFSLPAKQSVTSCRLISRRLKVGG